MNISKKLVDIFEADVKNALTSNEDVSEFKVSLPPINKPKDVNLLPKSSEVVGLSCYDAEMGKLKWIYPGIASYLNGYFCIYCAESITDVNHKGQPKHLKKKLEFENMRTSNPESEFERDLPKDRLVIGLDSIQEIAISEYLSHTKYFCCACNFITTKAKMKNHIFTFYHILRIINQYLEQRFWSRVSLSQFPLVALMLASKIVREYGTGKLNLRSMSSQTEPSEDLVNEEGHKTIKEKHLESGMITLEELEMEDMQIVESIDDESDDNADQIAETDISVKKEKTTSPEKILKKTIVPEDLLHLNTNLIKISEPNSSKPEPKLSPKKEITNQTKGNITNQKQPLVIDISNLDTNSLLKEKKASNVSKTFKPIEPTLPRKQISSQASSIKITPSTSNNSLPNIQLGNAQVRSLKAIIIEANTENSTQNQSPSKYKKSIATVQTNSEDIMTKKIPTNEADSSSVIELKIQNNANDLTPSIPKQISNTKTKFAIDRSKVINSNKHNESLQKFKMVSYNNVKVLTERDVLSAEKPTIIESKKPFLEPNVTSVETSASSIQEEKVSFKTKAASLPEESITSKAKDTSIPEESITSKAKVPSLPEERITSIAKTTSIPEESITYKTKENVSSKTNITQESQKKEKSDYAISIKPDETHEILQSLAVNIANEDTKPLYIPLLISPPGSEIPIKIYSDKGQTKNKSPIKVKDIPVLNVPDKNSFIGNQTKSSKSDVVSSQNSVFPKTSSLNLTNILQPDTLASHEANTQSQCLDTLIKPITTIITQNRDQQIKKNSSLNSSNLIVPKTNDKNACPSNPFTPRFKRIKMHLVHKEKKLDTPPGFEKYVSSPDSMLIETPTPPPNVIDPIKQVSTSPLTKVPFVTTSIKRKAFDDEKTSKSNKVTKSDNGNWGELISPVILDNTTTTKDNDSFKSKHNLTLFQNVVNPNPLPDTIITNVSETTKEITKPDSHTSLKVTEKEDSSLNSPAKNITRKTTLDISCPETQEELCVLNYITSILYKKATDYCMRELPIEERMARRSAIIEEVNQLYTADLKPYSQILSKIPNRK